MEREVGVQKGHASPLGPWLAIALVGDQWFLWTLSCESPPTEDGQFVTLAHITSGHTPQALCSSFLIFT